MAIWRHAEHALPPLMAKLQKRSERNGYSALDRIEKLVQRLEKLSEQCAEFGKGKDQLAVARELRPSIELLGRLTGEITTTNNALFVNLGVRDETEIRRALEFVRTVKGAPLESRLEDALALLKALLVEMPEQRSHVLATLGSYAAEVNGDEPDTSTRAIAQGDG